MVCVHQSEGHWAWRLKQRAEMSSRPSWVVVLTELNTATDERNIWFLFPWCSDFSVWSFWGFLLGNLKRFRLEAVFSPLFDSCLCGWSDKQLLSVLSVGPVALKSALSNHLHLDRRDHSSSPWHSLTTVFHIAIYIHQLSQPAASLQDVTSCSSFFTKHYISLQPIRANTDMTDRKWDINKLRILIVQILRSLLSIQSFH